MVPIWKYYFQVRNIAARQELLGGNRNHGWKKIMRRLGAWLTVTAAVAAAGAIIGNGALAVPLAGSMALRAAADQLSLVEKSQFVFGGHNYCWYDDGWHGAGWYWCGYRLHVGFGWGGRAGWHGWNHRTVHHHHHHGGGGMGGGGMGGGGMGGGGMGGGGMGGGGMGGGGMGGGGMGGGGMGGGGMGGGGMGGGGMGGGGMGGGGMGGGGRRG